MSDELPRDLTQGARDTMAYKTGYTVDGNAIWQLIHGIEVLHALVLSQQAEIRGLQDRLETYMTRSAPALSAARMHVPIGGGDGFWRRQQARRQEERRVEREQKLAALKARTADETKAIKEPFNDPEVTYEMESAVKKPRVRRKRSRKTTRGK